MFDAFFKICGSYFETKSNVTKLLLDKFLLSLIHSQILAACSKLQTISIIWGLQTLGSEQWSIGQPVVFKMVQFNFYELVLLLTMLIILLFVGSSYDGRNEH